MIKMPERGKNYNKQIFVDINYAIVIFTCTDNAVLQVFKNNITILICFMYAILAAVEIRAFLGFNCSL
jgi:hypothetical protein